MTNKHPRAIDDTVVLPREDVRRLLLATMTYVSRHMDERPDSTVLNVALAADRTARALGWPGGWTGIHGWLKTQAHL